MHKILEKSSVLVSVCSTSECLTSSEYVLLYVIEEKLFPCILPQNLLIYTIVHKPNSQVLQVLCPLEAVNFNCVLNTLQTSLCSQIHVCIVEYLSAINIYETTKISVPNFLHTIETFVFT